MIMNKPIFNPGSRYKKGNHLGCLFSFYFLLSIILPDSRF